MMTAAGRFILTLQGVPRRGLMATISNHVADQGASIEASAVHNDYDAQRFFMRTVLRFDEASPSFEALSASFAPLAKSLTLDWNLWDCTLRPRLLIAVSKSGHCLFDLLHRWRSGILGADIAGVISNHPDMRSFVEWSGLPYHYLPIEPGGRRLQEQRILDLVEELDVELLVLARYMQVLSADTCAQLAGRCINIHHSFLPSFQGADPYRRARLRGVKLIGATAHYVTPELDEGPIIEQDVERVHHGHSPDELKVIGRDVECRVLARAVEWHIDRRVFLNDATTVVFN